MVLVVCVRLMRQRETGHLAQCWSTLIRFSDYKWATWSAPATNTHTHIQHDLQLTYPKSPWDLQRGLFCGHKNTFMQYNYTQVASCENIFNYTAVTISYHQTLGAQGMSVLLRLHRPWRDVHFVLARTNGLVHASYTLADESVMWCTILARPVKLFKKHIS